jgi:hypothetical protein
MLPAVATLKALSASSGSAVRITSINGCSISSSGLRPVMLQ